jgi:hypothetical protein
VLAAVIAAAPLVLPASAHAVATDAMIEGAKMCTRYLPRYEREYGIPVHLLSAIASTESGRWHDGLRIALPWPWTINANGKAYYLNSKQEAVATASRLRAQGIQSMDVGCMQVNLYHHPNAFRSLDEAFEPENNVAYAASFLRSLYDEDKSWRSAAASYHSKTPAFGSQYVGQVYDRWYTIIDRVRSARADIARQANQPVAAASLLTSEERAAQQEASAVPKPVALIPAVSRQPAKPKAPAYQPVTMRVIEVKNEPVRKASDVLVIRPEQPVAPPVESADYAPASAPDVVPAVAVAPAAPAMAVPVPKVVQVSAPASSVSVKGGPRFIFND